MPKVTRILNKAQLDALDATAITLVSAPRDSGFIPILTNVILYKTGTQVAGTSRNLSLRYIGDTTALTTVTGINAAGGVLNSTVAAVDTSAPIAIAAIAGSACIGKGIECVLSGALTANSDNYLKIVVDYDLVQLT